jgi:PAS domain S-box-containing protein
MAPDTRKFLSLLLIPIFIILIAILLILNFGGAFNPPILLLVLKAVFLGLIPLYVAYIAYVSFRGSGSLGVLLNGTGMLLLGLTSFAAGIIGFLPDSQNITETVQSTNFFFCALLMVFGTILAIYGIVPKQRSGDIPKELLVYGGCVLYIILFSVAAIRGVFPPFFIPGAGYTFLRQFMIINAIEFFALVSVLLFFLYVRRREDFFFWYAIGLALIALGLVGVIFSNVPGGSISWVGREAQYLGAVYVLLAFIVLNRSAHWTGLTVGEMLSRFFRAAETNYKTLIETATDAVVVFDLIDRVIVWNPAAEMMFGYASAEAIGSSFFQLVVPEEFTGTVKNYFRIPVLFRADSTLHIPVEITVRRKDGSTFPVELSLSRHMVSGIWVITYIIRDISERKKTEAKMQDTFQRFYQILSNVQYGILLVTPQGRIEFANQHFCDMFSLTESPENLTGLSDKEMIDKIQDFYEEPAKVVDHIREIVSAGEPVLGEDINLKNGRVVLRDFVPIYSGGKISSRLWIHRDITERKRAEEALRNNIRLLEDVMEGSTSPIFLKDLEGKFISVNSALEKMLGMSRQELKGKTDYDLAPKEVADCWRSHDKIVIETGKALQIEEVADLPDRQYIFLANKFPLVDTYGRIYGVGAISHDITGRKKAEEALRESEERFRSILENNQDGYVRADKEGIITMVSPSAARMYGYSSPAEMTGLPASLLYGNQADRNSLLEEIENRGKVMDYESEALRKDGSTFPVSLNVQFYCDETGGRQGTEAFVRDITGRKNAERALAHLSSFPERNPNPIIEIDAGGHILYSNPSTVRLFPDIKENNHPFLAGLESVFDTPAKGIPELMVREVWAGERYYRQTTSYLPDIHRVRIYGMDITALKQAEEAILKKNTELESLNEELNAAQEELQQNLEELSLREQELIKSETGLKEALAEKEILLSEIHHRVKNNLTAFISLLSLDGSYEDTEAGRTLRKDLQNRARSMALIHETLYKTGNFANVDMEVYLNNLIRQIVGSYGETAGIRVVVIVNDVTIDIARATTAGLIINELVTNSFKYAFPPGFDCMAARGEPCTIRVFAFP